MNVRYTTGCDFTNTNFMYVSSRYGFCLVKIWPDLRAPNFVYVLFGYGTGKEKYVCSIALLWSGGVSGVPAVFLV